MKTSFINRIVSSFKSLILTPLLQGGVGGGLLAVAVAGLLCSCYHGKHEFQPAGVDGQAVGYLTPLLAWDDEADAGAAISDLHFIVGGTGGNTVTHDFTDVATAADWLQQLPVGDYDLLVTANMDEGHGYILENDGSRAAGEEELHTALPDTRVSLADPSSSPAQAWYAVTHATVRENEITVAEFHLQRLLSELTVTVGNVPAGTAITASAERVARSMLLTRRDVQGHYGVPGSDYLTASLGALTAASPVSGGGSASGGSSAGTITLRRDGHTLMPTAGGQERCYLRLAVTTPEGAQLTYLADAPRMESGRAYVLELDYTKLRPYMLLSAFTINDWTEGWIISGEIINPDR